MKVCQAFIPLAIFEGETLFPHTGERKKLSQTDNIYLKLYWSSANPRVYLKAKY
jgi:hypothetical protein